MVRVSHTPWFMSARGAERKPMLKSAASGFAPKRIPTAPQMSGLRWLFNFDPPTERIVTWPHLKPAIPRAATWISRITSAVVGHSIWYGFKVTSTMSSCTGRCPKASSSFRDLVHSVGHSLRPARHRLVGQNCQRSDHPRAADGRCPGGVGRRRLSHRCFARGFGRWCDEHHVLRHLPRTHPALVLYGAFAQHRYR